MRLTDLEPEFMTWHKEYGPREGIAPAGGDFGDPHWHFYHLRVPTLEEAQGVMFLCPVCFQKNGGRVGTHMVICWSESRGVPAEAVPAPGRWLMRGTGFHDLTLDGEHGGARSVLLTGGGCGWHGFVTDGEVSIL